MSDPIHESSEKLIVSGLDAMFVRSGTHKIMTGYDFLPTRQYPVDWMPSAGEFGALVKLNGAEVVKVYRRVFEARS